MKYPHMSTHQPVTCGNTRVRCSSRSGNRGRCCSIVSKPSVKGALRFLFRGSLRRWRNERCPERRVMDSAFLLSVRGSPEFVSLSQPVPCKTISLVLFAAHGHHVIVFQTEEPANHAVLHPNRIIKAGKEYRTSQDPARQPDLHSPHSFSVCVPLHGQIPFTFRI